MVYCWRMVGWFVAYSIATACGAGAMYFWTDPVGVPRDPSRLTKKDLAELVELWKAAREQFYRRRELAWRVWIGVWGIPSVLAALLRNDHPVSSTASEVIGVVGILLLLLIGWWARDTVRAARRDHAEGVRFRRRIDALVSDNGDPTGDEGPRRIALDSIVPFTLTGLLFFGLFWLLAAERVVV